MSAQFTAIVLLLLLLLLPMPGQGSEGSRIERHGKVLTNIMKSRCVLLCGTL